MLRLSLLKIWNKKWMNMCILVGVILLVATIVSFPMYEEAAYDRMLQDEFTEYLTSTGNYPTINSLTCFSKKDKKGTTLAKLEDFANKMADNLNVENKDLIHFYYLNSSTIHSEMDRADISEKTIKLSFLSDMDSHINLLYGEQLSESGLTKDGAIEVLIDQSAMLEKDLLLGETLSLENVVDKNGKPMRVFIKGVFDTSNNDDFYWQLNSADLVNCCFAREDLFRELFLGERIGKYSITCTIFQLFNYQNISYGDARALYDNSIYYATKSKYKSLFNTPAYIDTLESYLYKQTRISGTLKVLLIPVMILISAFLMMISVQMYGMEVNEISVIKSRGSYRRQIFLIYLYQNIVIVLIGGAVGTLLGRLLASILGATRNFLEFSTNEIVEIAFSTKSLIFALSGCIYALVVLTIPAIFQSRNSIVKVKQKKSEKKKPLWQKLFLDFILIGISLYGYYTFSKDLNAISDTVLSGESLDPLLYVSSSLFILGAGLLFLRLQPLLVSLIYVLGKSKWGPSGYISFMENKKNAKKQSAIMLLLIMTISLGMYHSIVARTILENSLANANYLDGTDIIIKQKWEAVRDENGMATGEYLEPDYKKFPSADFTKSCTKVYFDDGGYVSLNDSRSQTTVYGIHTKEFGQMTSLDSSLNEKAYHTYLNELAVEADGLLVSSNFASKYGLAVGDRLSFYSSDKKMATGRIVDFVDYWPGYASRTSVIDADGQAHSEEGFLVVTHFDLIHDAWKNVPYEVWLNLKDGYDSSDVAEFITDNRISVRKFVDKDKDIRSVLLDPLLQGTNGVLTLGFMVTIILCAIGYLIYWILSVKERELVFGVLRACGFHKEEIVAVLLSEQFFSGLLSCIAGTVIGGCTSYLFVPVLQYAYASKNQTLPMVMTIKQLDMIRLYGVIGASMLICLVVLIRILQSMNITKALKLGEE